MSRATLNTIMQRISIATEQSPVMVFDSGDPNKFNCVFGSTIESKQQLKNPKDRLVGVFHNGMNKHNVRVSLQKEFDRKFMLLDEPL